MIEEEKILKVISEIEADKEFYHSGLLRMQAQYRYDEMLGSKAVCQARVDAYDFVIRKLKRTFNIG